MPAFSKKSLDNLNTCHPDLQRLFREVIKYYDCSVICGHRTEEAQNKAVQDGASKLSWPHSKHNTLPSLAVDVLPYPIDWSDLERFYHFVGFVMGIAAKMEIPVRSGADWNGNMDIKDENFRDLPHFELRIQ